MKNQTTMTLENQVDSTVKHLIETSDQKHNQYLEYVKKVAFTLSQSRLPKENDELFGYIEEFIGYYQKERTNVLIALSSSIQTLLTQIGMTEPLKQINEKEKQLENMNRVLNNRANDRNSIKIERDVRFHKIYNIVTWIITLLECFWLALIFGSAFNDNNLSVMIGAFVISFGLIQSTKLTTLYFRDKKAKLWIKILAPMIILSIVISLGLVRYSSVVVTSDETITTYKYLNHPLIFIVLTMIPLLATALIVYKYHLSDTEIQQLREQEKIQSDCKNDEKKIVQCRKELKELTEHRNDVASASIKRNNAEQILIQRFDAYIKEAVGTFKHENLKHRDDSIYPVCFTKPSPALPSVVTQSNYPNHFENQLS